MSSRRVPSAETLSALKALLGDRLSTAASVLEQHGTDESYHAVAPPDAVAFVNSTEEVSEVIKICAAAGTPVIPFGAGSSLEGHISATEGGVSIDLTGMNNILAAENMSCKIEAGVTREQLNVDLRATGLMFPVDPGANATLGGMISTNASGTTTVRYGNMKTNVMSLTAVMADGRIIKTGSKTRKSSAGYDLTRLLIGSEGTLAVVTEAELKLFGIPEAEKTMICSFDTIKDAVDTCATVMQMGIPVARMELMDENAVEAINKYAKLDTAVRPSLIIEHHGSPAEVEEQSALVVEIANDFEAKDIELATDAEERKKLWSGRHAAWYATMNQMPGSRGLSTDVAVPFSKLADVIVETQQDLKDSELFGTIVGHVGDGNFHVMLPFFLDNEELMQKVRDFSDRLVKRALEYEGTCTGEHGIGNGKMNYLSKEHGDSVEVMHIIKKALDPKDIMNPGKIFYGTNFKRQVTPPDAVAFVKSTEEVSKVIKLCAATGTPVIPFGAGTSLEGHISAAYGGVSIDLSGMNTILKVDRKNLSCKVEAGVTREQLSVDLRATGLMFPVDPGANATIGGMISTNASGTTTVRYGNMKTNVMSLTAVLADGRIIKTGSRYVAYSASIWGPPTYCLLFPPLAVIRTRKSSAGYDLTRLLIGAEGTLAVVTEAELQLFGVPEAETAMICSFDTMKEAIDTCTTVMQMGIPVARMEMLDENAVDAVNKYSKLDNPSIILICTLILLACSHVGDGNFHVLLPFTDDDEEHMARMKAFSSRLVERALAYGGTCTGEHGIGIGKMDYLRREHGDAVDVMHAIKKALDPQDIMNPGKIFYGKKY
ncbi:hypothetical protein BBJ28_00015209 [Nothophytophthora sp. Chile5]|nr:hypothetical protein BBJ28_00015209 [Nothophytophthora sp. Chile5]